MTKRWPLAAILTLAMLVRLAAIFAAPSLHFWDENFQLFEQGHRLAFGYGILPWEFEDGLRSYVVPYALAGLFAVAEPVFGGPQGYIHVTQIVIAALSLAPVAAVYGMGRRTSPTHAVLAGLVAATWFEIVYFAFRPLTEALACDFVVVALALASAPREAISPRRLAIIGFCLAFAVMLRPHLAPAVLFVAAWLGRLEVRSRWPALALGAAPVLVLFGVVDWVTWGAPFSSLVRGVWTNLGQGKASDYGVRPAWLYLGYMIAFWGPMFPVLLFLAARRWRQSTVWIGFAAIVIASHTLIPHKEYRFIFPALACLVIAAAMGSADFVVSLGERMTSPRRRLLAVGVGAAWVTASAALAASPLFTPNWTRDRAVIEASYWLSGRPDLCGVAFANTSWYRTGGYAFLHRDAPMYFLGPSQGRAATQAFNYIYLDRAELARYQPGYAAVWCAAGDDGGQVCLARRPGPCTAVASLTPILRLHRLGDERFGDRGRPETSQ